MGGNPVTKVVGRLAPITITCLIHIMYLTSVERQNLARAVGASSITMAKRVVLFYGLLFV